MGQVPDVRHRAGRTGRGHVPHHGARRRPVRCPASDSHRDPWRPVVSGGRWCHAAGGVTRPVVSRGPVIGRLVPRGDRVDAAGLTTVVGRRR